MSIGQQKFLCFYPVDLLDYPFMLHVLSN